MRSLTVLTALALSAVVGCDDGVTTDTTTGTTTASSSGTGGSGTTGSTTGSSTTGAGGNASAPFTSKGASSYESQTALAATPQGDVVAAWIAFFTDGNSSIGYAVSHDGGELWSAPQYVAAPEGRLASNPVLAADSQGNFALGFLGFTPTGGPDEHIYVAKLPKGGESFGAAASADQQTQRDFDKPSIAFDADDDLLVTWADFTATPALVFARSTDGAPFTLTTFAADSTFGNLAYLCLDRGAGPNAPLYLVHLRQGATLALRKSTDHGQTWPLVASVAPPDVVFQDPTCAVHGADVTVAYASGMSGVSPGMNSPGADVVVLVSTDAAQTFAPPKSVGKLAPADQVLFPRVARDATGKLEVVFYEGVVDMPASLVRASSVDGVAWSVSEIAKPGTFTLDRTIASWLGDYIGIASPTTGMLSSYADNTEGKAHVQFVRAGTP